MKKRLAFVLGILLAGSTVFSGCGALDLDDEEEEEDKVDHIASTYANDSYSGNCSTTLAMKQGQLEISRRQRDTEKPMGDGDWTIMVYLCGSDLESEGYAAADDMDEATDAKFSENVHVIYQMGGCEQWYYDISTDSMERYELTSDGLTCVGEVDSASMGKSGTLADFVAWGVENYPAEHMGLVLWDHGSGSLNGVCFDDLYDEDSLTLREIDDALATVYDDMTDKFEFIGFDACLMGTLETANLLTPYARYMYGSQESEPGNGWNYTEILNGLARNPDMDGRELGKILADSYYEQCEENDDESIATFSIIDLSQVDQLLLSCNQVFQDMLESDSFAEIASGILKADNFGGNSKSEGYTNMVDLSDLLKAASVGSDHAKQALSCLQDAVVYQKNGSYHPTAGGLSIYYPLSIQGSTELADYLRISPSAYYNAFINKIAYGYNNGNVDSFDAASYLKDCSNILDQSYQTETVEENEEEHVMIDADSDLIYDIYFDDDGYYTVEFTDMDQMAYTACCVYYMDDESMIYLGTTEDVAYDYDLELVTDNFDGLWPSIDDVYLPIELISVTDTTTTYTCPILLNDEVETNLRIVYDWAEEEWSVIGLMDGVDEETGMASIAYQLKEGDVIAPIYYEILEDDTWEPFIMDEITYDGELEISYSYLPEADYLYNFEIGDIYGSCYYTPYVIFSIDEDGEVWFDPDEMYQ